MFGGAKKWADRTVAQKACKECKVDFQPTCGGNMYCVECKPVVKRRIHATAQRDWRAKNPELHGVLKTTWDLMSKYGITLVQYKDMLKAQDEKCAICKTDKADKRNVYRKFSVDHSHVTGAIRGLLCSACNTGIGLFTDDITKLKSAIAYLERNA